MTVALAALPHYWLWPERCNHCIDDDASGRINAYGAVSMEILCRAGLAAHLAAACRW